MTDVLIHRGNLETDTQVKRTPREDEARDKGAVSTSQGMPRISSQPQERGEKHGTDFPLSSQEEPTLLTHWPWTSSI